VTNASSLKICTKSRENKVDLTVSDLIREHVKVIDFSYHFRLIEESMFQGILSQGSRSCANGPLGHDGALLQVKK